MDDANFILSFLTWLRLDVVTAGAAVIAAGAALATLGFVGLPNRNIAKLQSVVQYFSEGDKREMVDARHRVLTSAQSGKRISDDDARQICNFFHCWGLLAQKRLLPIWVFDGSSGNRVLELYPTLENFINNQRRQMGNKDYAEGFIWIYKKIMRRRGSQ